MSSLPTLISTLFLALLVFSLLRFVARRFVIRQLYNPTRGLEQTPDEVGIDYESIPFSAGDGTRLHGWWVAHPGAKATILCLHGKSGTIADRLHWLEDLGRLPVNLFLFDYRGFGLSRGSPSEEGLHLDALAAYEVVRARHDDLDAPPVLLYGRSLGAAVAARLAASRPVLGLITENAFTSLHEVAADQYPGWMLRLLLPDTFDTATILEWVTAPVLMAHTRDDELIPYGMGQRLATKVRNLQGFIETTGLHGESGWPHTPSWWAAFEAFVLEQISELPEVHEPDDPAIEG